MTKSATDHATEPPLINASLITELAGVLPTQELAAMLARFAEELVHKHTQLEDALQNHDQNAICHVAHAMTGTCGTFGAMRLSDKCRALLEECEKHDARKPSGGHDSCPTAIVSHVASINDCIHETLMALEKALLEQGA